MDMTHGAYWEDGPTGGIQRVKYEGCNSADDLSRAKDDRNNLYQCCDTNLNFSTATCSEDDSEYGPYKKNKVTRQDPMSHRIIEKRRRDRMNNCLADLSRLIPTEYLKKGRGRIEKTEIIEMAIKHMKHLQHDHETPSEHYRMGYQECMSETMRFMVEVEGHFPREGICVRILNHLQKHCETLTRTNHPPNHSNVATNPHQSVAGANNSHHPSENNNVVNHINNNHVQVHQTPPKGELNNNTHNGNLAVQPANDADLYDKHMNECLINGNPASYKYKTNIKMRFSQDVNEAGTVNHHHHDKRQRVDNGRRASVVSVENHSSSRSSPPSSEVCGRISDHEHSRVSPTESTLSLKMESAPITARTPLYSPTPVLLHHNNKQPPHDEKVNFNVPIFVLNAKAAYYIPLTIDYKTLVPYLRNYDMFQVVQHHNHNNIVLHPVTINVNYHPGNFLDGKYKSELDNNNWNC